MKVKTRLKNVAPRATILAVERIPGLRSTAPSRMIRRARRQKNYKFQRASPRLAKAAVFVRALANTP